MTTRPLGVQPAVTLHRTLHDERCTSVAWRVRAAVPCTAVEGVWLEGNTDHGFWTYVAPYRRLASGLLRGTEPILGTVSPHHRFVRQHVRTDLSIGLPFAQAARQTIQFLR
jgi:hypothetical protein